MKKTKLILHIFLMLGSTVFGNNEPSTNANQEAKKIIVGAQVVRQQTNPVNIPQNTISQPIMYYDWPGNSSPVYSDQDIHRNTPGSNDFLNSKNDHGNNWYHCPRCP